MRVAKKNTTGYSSIDNDYISKNAVDNITYSIQYLFVDSDDLKMKKRSNEKNNEEKAWEFASELLSALSPSKKKTLENDERINMMVRAITSVTDLKKEKLLTESEADSLLKLIASRFVDQSVSDVMKRYILELELPNKSSIFSMTEKFNKGEE